MTGYAETNELSIFAAPNAISSCVGYILYLLILLNAFPIAIASMNEIRGTIISPLPNVSSISDAEADMFLSCRLNCGA